VHVPWIASLIGPVHGCAYLLVIGAAFRLTRSAATTLLAAVPVAGGLIALRRVKQPDRPAFRAYRTGMPIPWREALVAGLGLLTLASGFLPWWVVSDDRGETYTASAWLVSSRWSQALFVTAVSVVLGLVWCLFRDRAPVVLWLAALVGVTLAVFLALDQRADTRPPAPQTWTITQGITNISTDPTGEIAAGWMRRDKLEAYHSEGLNVDVGWGFWAGLTGMVLTGLSLAVVGRRPRDSGGG
jgi:hypothetical protein